jgi:hypothetical protein
MTTDTIVIPAQAGIQAELKLSPTLHLDTFKLKIFSSFDKNSGKNM